MPYLWHCGWTSALCVRRLMQLRTKHLQEGLTRNLSTRVYYEAGRKAGLHEKVLLQLAISCTACDHSYPAFLLRHRGTPARAVAPEIFIRASLSMVVSCIELPGWWYFVLSFL